ncbi:hypothetical protein EYF80_017539 [Liparis tanakae]|uniref:Uncharacterized protein n=1 Tax=Liparis tanakae TaxID=230148 RepID=A0A4Z2I471_9TELE|nr:hypothetical protein EYF80_017539 [Liparis tanakae]
METASEALRASYAPVLFCCQSAAALERGHRGRLPHCCSGNTGFREGAKPAVHCGKWKEGDISTSSPGTDLKPQPPSNYVLLRQPSSSSHQQVGSQRKAEAKTTVPHGIDFTSVASISPTRPVTKSPVWWWGLQIFPSLAHASLQLEVGPKHWHCCAS